MKTAEEWVRAVGEYYTGHDAWNKVSPTQVKQIQLDAMREGMRRAATIAYHKEQNQREVERAILSAAEQLTEKDL